MEEDTVRQLPDGEELVLVRTISPLQVNPAQADPYAARLHQRPTATSAKGSGPSARPASAPPSDVTGKG